MIRKLLHIIIIVCLTAQSFQALGLGRLDDDHVAFGSAQTLAILLNQGTNAIESHERFDAILSHLRDKRSQYDSDQQYLHYIYRYVHRKGLKTYKTYVTLDQTLSKSGYYDCLTGTLLYGLLLQELGYEFIVREFRYHVLLIVKLDSGEIMFEATDPLNGFVVGKPAIDHRIAEFVESDKQKIRKSIYNVSPEIDNLISLEQLTGLHFYNQAIYFLNHNDLAQAKSKIRKSLALYPSERVSAITRIIYGNEIKTMLAAND